RFRDHERMRRARFFARGAGEPCRLGNTLVVLQDAESGLGYRLEPVRVFPAAQPILAIAEQREVIRREPVEKRTCFVAQRLRHAAARRELAARVDETLAPRTPVLDRRAPVPERAPEPGLAPGPAAGIRLPPARDAGG